MQGKKAEKRSDLLLNALVFVVETVVRAGARMPREKMRHFVLVEIHLADVGLIILVVIVKNAAFAVGSGGLAVVHDASV